METPDLDTETYESIPWSQLTPPRQSPLVRIAVGIAGVAAAAVLAVVVAGFLREAPQQTVVSIPPESAAAPADAAVAVDELGPPVTTPGATPPAPTTVTVAPDVLYSEADLMAVIPEQEQRMAILRAEWFVTDFFTVDGDASTAAAVRAALPPGLAVALPHDAPVGVSYVEWAGALGVEPMAAGRYAVDVAFRTLAGPGDGTLTRMPVRGVRVVVLIDDSGVAVVDLPEPIEVPVATVDVAYPAPAEPPPEVVAQALTRADAVGAGEAMEAGVDATGWRIVLAVTDASGLAWPMVVHP